GKKTAAYRQVGNAFPPPFAKAVAESLRTCLVLLCYKQNNLV
ncbi:MAG: DNA (cytosine-5-)-methyltransferase, partial [Bryobacteraceae bacterium]